MEDTKTTQATFRRLGELGIHLSIDDFGTGYSSLAYLRQLPAEELKIDRSFVMDLEHSADARAVVDAVIKLAHALGLKVVAEGVENQRQQQILVADGLRRAAGLPLRQADVGAGAAALGDQRPPGNRRLQALAVRRDEAVRARLRAAGAHLVAAAGAIRRRRARLVAGNARFIAMRWESSHEIPRVQSPRRKKRPSTQESIMSDNILSAVLTFSLLAGGTAAIGSEMFDTRQPATGPGRRHADGDGHRAARRRRSRS